MSIAWWNGVLNVVTNIDYLAIPVAFLVLRNLREPDVPPRVLWSRVLFVLACGAHHGVMAAVLFTAQPLWVIRTIVNAAMAGVSCWSLVEHLRWARVKPKPITVREHSALEAKVRERTSELVSTLQELRDAQSELVRHEKFSVLGQFSSGIGHELRNPLGVMRNAVYFLKATASDSHPRTGRYLDILDEQIRVSEKIVGDLLDFTRAETPQPEVVSLRTLVEEQLERVDPDAGVEVTIDIPDDLEAWCDRVQAGQVLFNLMTNAYQALDDRPERSLRVTARAGEDDQLTLQLADTGHGIDPADLDRIFDPLFTKRARGIGLGLALSKAFVEANGGAISLTSVPGEGTTFTVTLPSSAESLVRASG